MTLIFYYRANKTHFHRKVFALSLVLKARVLRHLHISHNAAYLPPAPPQILHKHCFQFLLGRLQYPGEMKNKGYAKFLFFGGGGGGHYRRSASGVAYSTYLTPGGLYPGLCLSKVSSLKPCLPSR